jgi:prepilin-type N-terminal cleavage/methylation domain-containing protein
MSKGIYVRHNRSGFTPIEFVVGLAVIGMLVLAVYLYQKDQQADDYDSVQTTEEYNTEQETYPTPEPVPTDSSDAQLNQTANEVNQLSGEINELDTIEEDLSLPSVEFEE